MDAASQALAPARSLANCLAEYLRLAREYEADAADRPDLWGQMLAAIDRATATPARDAGDVAAKASLLAAFGAEGVDDPTTPGGRLLGSILADALRITGNAAAASEVDEGTAHGLGCLRANALQRGHRQAAALLARHGVRRFANLTAPQVARELRQMRRA